MLQNEESNLRSLEDAHGAAAASASAAAVSALSVTAGGDGAVLRLSPDSRATNLQLGDMAR